MSGFARIFSTLMGGLFGAASAVALAPALAASDAAAGIVYTVVALGAAFGFFAPTVRRALGRGFLLLGTAVFILPLSAMLLSGKAGQEVVSTTEPGHEAAGAIGAGIAGIAFTGVSALIGFSLGGVLLLIGLVLVLGGRREVTVR